MMRRAVGDLEFRKRLTNAPRAVLMEAGVEVPAEKKITVLESADDSFYVVLPPLRGGVEPTSERFSFAVIGDRLVLRGRLDATSVAETRDELLALEGNLIVDLAVLTYISSAGLGLLLMLLKKMKKAEHNLRLINIQPAVRNVFVLTGFDRVFDI